MLAACGTGTPAQQLATVVNDVSTIANAFVNALPALAATTGKISPVAIANVQQAVATLQTLATQLSGVATTTAAQPIITQVEATVNLIVNTLAPFSVALPPPWGEILPAVAVLLPVVELAVGLVVPASAPLRRAAVPGLTPDEARVILHGIAGK